MLQRKKKTEFENIEFKHSYGQHMLENPSIAKAIVDKAGLRDTDTVVEIGPGTGCLTSRLLDKVKRVIAIEFDHVMIMGLKRRFKGTNHEHHLTLIHGDIMKIELPFFDVCVANIPYQLSSPITFKLLSHRPFIRAAIIMYQLEFAMCLIAKPGETCYGRLAVNTQLVSDVKYLFRINKNNFRPVPKVESCVLRLEPKIPRPSINMLEWDGLIRLCFGRKHKTLGAIFRNNATLVALEHKFHTNRTFLLESESQSSNLNSLWKEKSQKKCSPGFKKVILSLLSNRGFDEMRSVKMSQDDLIKLLVEMNSKGIYFS